MSEVHDSIHDNITTYIKVYPNIEIYLELDLLVTPSSKSLV